MSEPRPEGRPRPAGPAPAAPDRLSGAAVIPLATLDPAAPLDDLGWLDAVAGDARVVAIGESAHYNAETYRLRHRLLRYLVERHGFGAYAMETGFTEGWTADAWVRGAGSAPDRLGEVLARGVTSLMGLWTQMGDHLEWMRGRNRTAASPVGFYGIDLGGSNVSLLPSLDAALGYLAAADPGFGPDPAIRAAAASFAVPSAFSAGAALAGYGRLAPEAKDALTAGLARLTARMTALGPDYRRRTSAEDYERALRSLRHAAAIDTLVRALSGGEPQAGTNLREAAIADTVEWILGREDRIVLAAHNGHVQRWYSAVPGMPAFASAGLRLAERLGGDYRVIGVTSGTGRTLNTGPGFHAGELFTEQPAPRPGSLDALMAASHDGAFATDLRRLAPADTAAVRAAGEQRHGGYYAEADAIAAFDAIVHLPRVTAAEPDRAALAHAPAEVQEAFSAHLGG
ncbi:erythromycin esterase family protein [Allonocardiopsis opalescens]|uniref:Erythromycin esterase n=1 Tax=Allonocardiopsis opalescens TaxID=1144618 RepID=A0A2T0QEX2_9ACTN|nr:erythromycin esterase family protein [Allonocardiopsis opalescens]PRY02440.1 erythromycin esterase [Allonocardiopsis opalescens]